jgi:hypothetical protein
MIAMLRMSAQRETTKQLEALTKTRTSSSKRGEFSQSISIVLRSPELLLLKLERMAEPLSNTGNIDSY